MSGLEKLDMAAILMMFVAILGFVWAVDASSTTSTALSTYIGILPATGGASLTILLVMLNTRSCDYIHKAHLIS